VSDIVILDRVSHRDLRVHAGASSRMGDAQRFVQVVVKEFPHLAAHYPILISKDSETGAFFCGAMMGFDEGENLFLKPGGGQDSYRPLTLQRGPFFSAGSDLAIDLDHPRLNDVQGEPLFNEAGEPTAYLQSIMALMCELQPGGAMTRMFLDRLLELRLIEPIDINLSFDDGEKRELTGLYTIDQNALRDLPDADVLELFRRGYLHLIYVMIASLKQISVLARMRNDRLVAGGGALPAYER